MTKGVLGRDKETWGQGLDRRTGSQSRGNRGTQHERTETGRQEQREKETAKGETQSGEDRPGGRQKVLEMSQPAHPPRQAASSAPRLGGGVLTAALPSPRTLPQRSTPPRVSAGPRGREQGTPNSRTPQAPTRNPPRDQMGGHKRGKGVGPTRGRVGAPAGSPESPAAAAPMPAPRLAGSGEGWGGERGPHLSQF